MAEQLIPLQDVEQDYWQIDEWFESQEVLVLQFPNLFDPSESAQKHLDKQVKVSWAKQKLIRMFRSSNKDLEKNHSLLSQLREHIPFLNKSYEGPYQISKREFINYVISSLLWAIRHRFKAEYRLFSSRDQDEVFCVVRISEEWLRNRAEVACYTLQFKEDPLDNTEIYPYKQIAPWATYETHRLGTVQNSIKYFKKFDLDDNEIKDKQRGSLFRYSDKARILYDALNEAIDFNLIKSVDALQQDYLIHNQKWIDFFSQNWCSVKAVFKPQPLKEISVYFGEKIGMYFAWMNCYMKSLFTAAGVGVIVFILMIVFPSEEKGLNIRNMIPLLYAVFICLWGSVFDQVWVRNEKWFSWQWGTLNFNDIEEQRAEFKGQYEYDEVCGKYKKVRQGRTMYKFRKFISYSVISVFIAIVIIAVTSIMIYKALDKASYVPILCAILNAVQINVLNLLYGWIAQIMTSWENHETETVHSDSLAVKLFFFQFVNSYASLFYIAFAKSFFDDHPDQHNYIDELALVLGTIFGLNLVLNIIELGIPYFMYLWEIYLENRKVKKMAITQPGMRTEMGFIEKQSKLWEYESPVDDYMEMALQYGYLVLFCAAFPLTPLLALIEIVLEIKVDAWKLCKLTKRPRPYRGQDIGVWRFIMLSISYMGAFTNAALIMFASPACMELENYEKCILFFILEHTLMFAKYAISVSIPDVPKIIHEAYKWSRQVVQTKLYGKKPPGRREIRQTKSFVLTQQHKNNFRIIMDDVRYVEESS